MRVLLFGATGLLGQALMRRGQALGHTVIGAARSGADYAVDLGASSGIDKAVERLAPDVVINAAALTSIEECERNPELAHTVNAGGVSAIAEACRGGRVRFVQISTDHYFTGDRDRLHDEAAPVQIVNAYARSKFAGEQFALRYSETLVIRTNMTGRRGWPQPTFFEWCVRSLRERAPMALFDDYFTSTIDTAALAHALFNLIDKKVAGVLNLAAREVSSKRAFVEALAGTLGIDLNWAKTASVRTLAVPRAESAGLDVTRAETILGYALPDLSAVVASLGKESA